MGLRVIHSLLSCECSEVNDHLCHGSTKFSSNYVALNFMDSGVQRELLDIGSGNRQMVIVLMVVGSCPISC